MATLITSDILSVLNNVASIENKRIELMKMRKNKCGQNRHLIDIVCDMMKSYVLPLKHTDSLKIINNDFSETEYDKLKVILINSNCSYFNAICGEMLWMKKHDIKIAKKTLISYEKELSNPSISNEHIYTELSVGICRVYSKCKVKDFDFESFLQKSIQHVKANYDVNGYGILFILNALLDCCENSARVVLAFEDAISYYESKNMLDKVVNFLNDLETFYKNNRCQKELKSTRVRIAQFEEKYADKYDWQNPEHAHNIISHVHSAMNAWKRAADKEYKPERKRLAKRIEPVKKLSLETMKLISSGEIDISEWIAHEKQSIENATIESFIYKLATMIPLESYESAKQKLQKKDFFYSGLFSSVTLDSEGRKKRIIPSVLGASQTDMDAILQSETAKIYTLCANIYVSRLLYLAQQKFVFTKEQLRFLVEENLFVPQGHKEAFLMGLVAGFNSDLITAMHLLMPQVECCIRCLVDECGAVVYKTDEQGVEECLSLSQILKLPEVNELLDETFLFNLKLFLTSEYGFGMRDDVCHGLHTDSELQSADCLAVWWFILRICCTYSRNLHKRLNEQKQRMQKH